MLLATQSPPLLPHPSHLVGPATAPSLPPSPPSTPSSTRLAPLPHLRPIPARRPVRSPRPPQLCAHRARRPAHRASNPPRAARPPATLRQPQTARRAASPRRIITRAQPRFPPPLARRQQLPPTNSRAHPCKSPPRASAQSPICQTRRASSLRPRP